MSESDLLGLFNFNRQVPADMRGRLKTFVPMPKSDSVSSSARSRRRGRRYQVFYAPLQKRPSRFISSYLHPTIQNRFFKGQNGTGPKRVTSVCRKAKRSMAANHGTGAATIHISGRICGVFTAAGQTIAD
jgi:hypothetical protein